ncbi:metallophosphoesterase family protein [Desulfonatronum thioautotrophicum]|uniref:metallophosphoesterase family protein n=1 Tax=Desulfonatronum thioautotrophicum TaxID=617001 RepID=UPI000699FF48|nr:metallophosphoesterase [Desulfonatronum thioautotrophicum]
MRVLLAGDTHGEFQHVLSCSHEADAIIFLGDQTPKRDFKSELGAVADKSWFVLGNHDSDHLEFLQNHKSMLHRCLHCTVEEFGGIRVAGLNGIFMRRFLGLSNVDLLKDLYSLKPFYHSRRDCLWYRSLGYEYLTAIFPEDIEHMIELQADVLVCHEAPECHRHGFMMLGDLARTMGVKLLIHGHHHERYEDVIEEGIKVVGLGPPGEFDPITEQDEGLDWLHHLYPWQIA